MVPSRFGYVVHMVVVVHMMVMWYTWWLCGTHDGYVVHMVVVVHMMVMWYT